jgi:hypothetical protein
VHHGWHGAHRYDIQVLATHASIWVHRYFLLLQWSVPTATARSRDNGGAYTVRSTISTWPRLPKGTDHCSSEEYRCTHVDACLYIVSMCAFSPVVLTLSISSYQKYFFSFPVAVNNSMKLCPLVFLLQMFVITEKTTKRPVLCGVTALQVRWLSF